MKMVKTTPTFAEIFVPQILLVEMPISIPTPHTLVPATQIRERSITICGASKRRRYGLARSGKIVQSALYIASKLSILPEPFDSLVQEFGIGGGNRGGPFGHRKGLGGGGSDGWGWRRRRRKLGVLVVSGLGLWFVLGRRLDRGVLIGSLGLGLFGLSIDGWRRGMKDWVLGFCCCAFLLSLVLKKEDFHNLVASVLSIKDSPKCSKSFFGRRRK